MTDREYLAELNEHLSVLPDIEREAAMSFYKLVFDKSGNALDVMIKYGNPYALAKRVISEHSDFNETMQYQNLKKDGMTASTAGNYNETYDKVKEAVPDSGGHYLHEPYGYANAKGKLSGGHEYGNTAYDEPDVKPQIQKVQAIQTENTSTSNKTPGYAPPPGYTPGQSNVNHKSRRSPRRYPPWHIDKNDPNMRKIRKKRLLIIGIVCACVMALIPVAFIADMRQQAIYNGYYMEHATTQIADFDMMPPAAPIAPEAPEYPFVPDNGDYADPLLPAVDYDYGYTTESFAASIRSVNITASNCDIRITNGSTPSIDYSSGVEFSVQDGVLTVTSANPGAVVNIYLSGIGNNVDLSLNGGSADISNVTLDTLNINYIGTGSSGVIITNCTVNRTAICDVVAPNAAFTVENSTFGVNSKFSSSGTDMMIYGNTFDSGMIINSDAGYTAVNGCSFKNITINTYANDTYMDSTSLKGDMWLTMRGGTGNFNLLGYPENYTIALADPYAEPAAEEFSNNYKITLDANGVTQNDLSIVFTPPM